jgi:hypothetical protein
LKFLKLRNNSFLHSHRMDNLLKVRSWMACLRFKLRPEMTG